MTRIAMISEHASPAALLGGEDAGGQNVYVDEISRSLASLDIDVDVFTRRDDQSQPEIQHWSDGVRIINLTAGPASSLKKDDIWPFMPEMRDALLRFARRDLVQYDLVHGNFWMSGWIAAELRTRRRIPCVQLFHALGMTKRRHQGCGDTSPDDRIDIESAVIRGVDRVIATCPDEVVQLSTDYHTPAHQIAMIPLGVDPVTFHPVDKQLARHRIGLGLGPEDRVLVYVGRVVPRKGIRNIVRALPRLEELGLHDVKLLVVGGETSEPDPVATPEIGAIQTLARELGVTDRVILTGKRGRDELLDYYGSADAVVTTPWYEPFGLTPLEAMACGRAVIGSKVGGIAYTIQPEKTGLHVGPEDPEALAAAVFRLLSDGPQARQMGECARRRVEQLFTWSAVAQRTAHLYAEVLETASMNSRISRVAAGG